MPWSGGGLLFCLAFLVWANSYVIMACRNTQRSYVLRQGATSPLTIMRCFLTLAYALMAALAVADEKCCVGECEAGLAKYYSIAIGSIFPLGYNCGETCLDPADFWCVTLRSPSHPESHFHPCSAVAPPRWMMTRSREYKIFEPHLKLAENTTSPCADNGACMFQQRLISSIRFLLMLSFQPFLVQRTRITRRPRRTASEASSARSICTALTRPTRRRPLSRIFVKFSGAT